MKSIPVLASLLLISSSAPAAQYFCKGYDSASRNRDSYVLTIDVSRDEVRLTDDQGDEFELPRLLRRNEAALKYATYVDGGYDGYGGYVSVSVPKNVAQSTRKVSGRFVAYYKQVTYSESGKHGEIAVKATCSSR